MRLRHKTSLIFYFSLFQVIDVGSGKGYLCTFLSVQFNLQVFGIDSSSTNTHGAQERNRKLKKFSKAYKKHTRATRNQEAQPSNDGDDRTEKHSYSDQEVGSTNGSTPAESWASRDRVTNDVSSKKAIECTANPNDCDSGDSLFNMLSPDVVEDNSPRVHPSQLSEEERERRKRENLERKTREGLRSGSDDILFSPLTSYVTAETELKTLITELEVRGHLCFFSLSFSLLLSLFVIFLALETPRMPFWLACTHVEIWLQAP